MFLLEREKNIDYVFRIKIYKWIVVIKFWLLMLGRNNSVCNFF